MSKQITAQEQIDNVTVCVRNNHIELNLPRNMTGDDLAIWKIEHKKEYDKFKEKHIKTE